MTTSPFTVICRPLARTVRSIYGLFNFQQRSKTATSAVTLHQPQASSNFHRNSLTVSVSVIWNHLLSDAATVVQSCGFTYHSTQNRSFRRRSSQPVSWLGTKKLKQTPQKQSCTRNKIYYSSLFTTRVKKYTTI